MKILINGYYNFLPKGQETFSGPRNLLESFLEYMDENGHVYTALVIRGKKIKDSKIKTQRIKTSSRSSWLVATLRLNTPDVFKAKKPGIPKSLKEPLEKITQIIAAENPDIVFINGMSISNWYIIKAAKKLGIPVIVNHLGLWFKEITEYGGTSSGIKIMREMEKDLVRLSDKNIFLSKLSFRHFSKELIRVPKNKIEFVPNPVDEIYLKGKPKRISPKLPIKVGIVARWDPIKNHRAFLLLVKMAKKQNLPWEFYSVTTIHKKYSWSKDIRNEYKKYIHILPPMTPAELKKFYQFIDIMVLPSHFDVSPTVVMEALMQNKITLISPTVGLVDAYKENGAADLVVDFSDPKRVITQIKKQVFNTPPKKLFNYVKKHYRGDFSFAQYIKIARSLIK